MVNLKKGLFIKVYGLILVPTIAFLIFGALYLKDNYQIYKNTSHIKQMSSVIDSSFQLLFNLQKERGMSAAYSSGADNLSLIKKQRKIVDKKIERYKTSSLNIENPTTRDETLRLIGNIQKLRSNIKTKKVAKTKIVKVYTEAVRSLLSKANQLGYLSQNSSIVQTLLNIFELGEGMESGGLLRANMSSLIARNKGARKEEKIKISTLKARYDSFSLSPSIRFQNKKSAGNHQSFLESAERSIIDDTFLKMMGSSQEGNYQLKATQFFSLISKPLDKLAKTISSEIQYLYLIANSNYIKARHMIILMSSLITLYLLIAVFYTFKTVVKLVSDFRVSLHTLNNKAFTIALSTANLNKNSKVVSEASSKQSSEIEEISAAIYEINRIQDSTKKQITDSKSLTDETTSDAQAGQQKVEKLINCINLILKSNKKIQQQVDQNDKELQKVINIINEIAEKTSVINDIVFQTKLLSFNASVEAARAGEHGKGFSIVAEEVGALANLSGSAADEIANLVTNSVEMVATITEKMKKETDSIIEQNNKNIETGNQEAEDFKTQFKQIVKSVSKVNTAMAGAHSSYQNQADAILNISKNISSLENATKSNLVLIDKNDKTSNTIEKNLNRLKDVVDEMCVIIRGEKIPASENSSREQEVA